MVNKIIKALCKRQETLNKQDPYEQTLTKSFIDFLQTEGYSMIRVVPGRGVCAIKRFIFTTGLCIGLVETGYKGRYCYETFAEAQRDICTWDGEDDPEGDWIKYKGEGGERVNNTNTK